MFLSFMSFHKLSHVLVILLFLESFYLSSQNTENSEGINDTIDKLIGQVESPNAGNKTQKKAEILKERKNSVNDSNMLFLKPNNGSSQTALNKTINENDTTNYKTTNNGTSQLTNPRRKMKMDNKTSTRENFKAILSSPEPTRKNDITETKEEITIEIPSDKQENEDPTNDNDGRKTLRPGDQTDHSLEINIMPIEDEINRNAVRKQSKLELLHENPEAVIKELELSTEANNLDYENIPTEKTESSSDFQTKTALKTGYIGEKPPLLKPDPSIAETNDKLLKLIQEILVMKPLESRGTNTESELSNPLNYQMDNILSNSLINPLNSFYNPALYINQPYNIYDPVKNTRTIIIKKHPNSLPVPKPVLSRKVTVVQDNLFAQKRLQELNRVRLLNLYNKIIGRFSYHPLYSSYIYY